MTQRISIVIPVYNNQQTLEENCRQLQEIHRVGFSDMELEIVFVNDGSKDGSWAELLRLKELYGKQIVLINLSRNFGQHGALFAGFGQASGDAVICLSADLQDPIALIGKMVALWKAGSDIVICHRENRQDGSVNRIGSRLAYAMARIASPELPQGGFDYWLMSRKVCRLLCSFKGRHNFIQGYLCSLGFSKAYIPYTRTQRKVGRSGYTLRKKINIIIDFLIDSSYVPIRAMTAFGSFVAAAGLLYSLLICYAWFMHQTPFPGWAPIMIMVMIIGGSIMIMIGIIGEYIWRMYDDIKDFPKYIIAQKLGETRDE